MWSIGSLLSVFSLSHTRAHTHTHTHTHWSCFLFFHFLLSLFSLSFSVSHFFSLLFCFSLSLSPFPSLTYSLTPFLSLSFPLFIFSYPFFLKTCYIVICFAICTFTRLMQQTSSLKREACCYFMTQQFIKLVTLKLVLQYVLFETAHSSIYGLYQLYFPMQPGNSITNTLIFSFILEQWRHNCFICAKLVTSIIMVNGNIYFCGNYYHYFSIETCNCIKPRAYIFNQYVVWPFLFLCQHYV